MEWFKARVEIIKTRNGYAVRPPVSWMRCNDAPHVDYGDEFSFETIDQLVQWLKANIGNDAAAGWRKV